jgi:hypothetical protein
MTTSCYLFRTGAGTWEVPAAGKFFLNQVTSHLSPGLGIDFFLFPPGPPEHEDNALYRAF